MALLSDQMNQNLSLFYKITTSDSKDIYLFGTYHSSLSAETENRFFSKEKTEEQSSPSTFIHDAKYVYRETGGSVWSNPEEWRSTDELITAIADLIPGKFRAFEKTATQDAILAICFVFIIPYGIMHMLKLPLVRVPYRLLHHSPYLTIIGIILSCIVMDVLLFQILGVKAALVVISILFVVPLLSALGMVVVSLLAILAKVTHYFIKTIKGIYDYIKRKISALFTKPLSTLQSANIPPENPKLEDHFERFNRRWDILGISRKRYTLRLNETFTSEPTTEEDTKLMQDLTLSSNHTFLDALVYSHERDLCYADTLYRDLDHIQSGESLFASFGSAHLPGVTRSLYSKISNDDNSAKVFRMNKGEWSVIGLDSMSA
jgi:hypothetical protein